MNQKRGSTVINRKESSRSRSSPPNLSLLDLKRIIATHGQLPLTRAIKKVDSFVNLCVTDKDFRDAQSIPLLELLIVVRDVLIDGATEHWTLNDYIRPIESKMKSIIASKKNADLKLRCQEEYLEAVRADATVKKSNFAHAFLLRHGLQSPKAKRIAEVWLSQNSLAAVRK